MIINKSSNVGIIKTAKNENGGVVDLTSASITATFKESVGGTNLFIKRNTTAGGSDDEIKVLSATNGIYEIKVLAANISNVTRRNIYCIVTIVGTANYSDQFWITIKDNKGTEITSYSASGGTANRPTLTSAEVGFEYFDIDLDSPVWWNGSSWV